MAWHEQVGKWRRKRKLTLAAMGEMCGVSAVTLGRIESGLTDPRLSTAQRIMEVMRGRGERGVVEAAGGGVRPDSVSVKDAAGLPDGDESPAGGPPQGDSGERAGDCGADGAHVSGDEVGHGGAQGGNQEEGGVSERARQAKLAMLRGLIGGDGIDAVTGEIGAAGGGDCAAAVPDSVREDPQPTPAFECLHCQVDYECPRKGKRVHKHKDCGEE